jgi:CDP-glycerol glycerophosphotransferase (TagB/SpsB family)
MDLMTPEELAQWRSSWDSLPNTYTDVEFQFTALALASDAMITDGVSFIAEYPLVTRKPVIFWEKEDHWEFSPLGKIARDSAYAVSTITEVRHAVNLVQKGQLPSRTLEIQKLIDAVRPAQASAAAAIVSLVKQDARVAK